MAVLDEIDGHIGLRPHCGICGSLMKVDERFLVLLGNIDSTAYSHRTGPFIFPDYGHNIRSKNGISICRRPGCRLCLVSAEASTIHSDCFEFVAQRCKLDDYLDYLWIATAWRTPWRKAPHIHLEETAVIPDFSMLNAFGISRLILNPPEILHIIYSYSATSLFWRYSKALNLIQQISPTSELLSVPLCAVLTWKRGGLPVIAETICPLPIIRLTIDPYGIKKIERLPEHPRFKTWRTSRLAFVILGQSCVQGVIAHFKFGLSRLELHKTCYGLQIWDTPTPPNLEQCLFHPADITSATQFRTIELCKITGITLFFCFGEVYAVHAHTRAAPCAEATYYHLSRRRQRSVTWVYIPIPRNDFITVIGAQIVLSDDNFSRSTCLLFRIKLAGDIAVGLNSSRSTKDIILSGSPPSTLIYDTIELQPIAVIGAYAKEKGEDLPITPFCHPLVDEPPFPNACFSLAPLKSVSRVGIFNNKQNGVCMGMLLDYENGAQRSLGQCRVNIDPVEYCMEPVWICLYRRAFFRPRTMVQLQATIVKSTNRCDHSHDDEGWTCFPMRGDLEFWFSDEETKLTAIIDK